MMGAVFVKTTYYTKYSFRTLICWVWRVEQGDEYLCFGIFNHSNLFKSSNFEVLWGVSKQWPDGMVWQDPTGSLIQLAESRGFANRFHALSLGQGQAPIATRYLMEGVKDVSVFVFFSFEHFLWNTVLFFSLRTKAEHALSSFIFCGDTTFFIWLFY